MSDFDDWLDYRESRGLPYVQSFGRRRRRLMAARMKEVGNVSQFPDLSAIYQAIFNRSDVVILPGGQRLRCKPAAGGTIRLVKQGDIAYVEQNPSTGSVPAQRAKLHGAKIVWIIKDNPQGGRGTYLGVIDDGLVKIDEAALSRCGLV